MGAIVWKTPECQAAFKSGAEAAARGSTRHPRTHYASRNEKAAFFDGWDSHTGMQVSLPGPVETVSRRS